MFRNLALFTERSTTRESRFADLRKPREVCHEVVCVVAAEINRGKRSTIFESVRRYFVYGRKVCCFKPRTAVKRIGFEFFDVAGKVQRFDSGTTMESVRGNG